MLEKVNLSCPRCGNRNNIRSLRGIDTVYQFKCINCNSYFKNEDFAKRECENVDKLEQVIKDVELGLRIAKGTDCGLFKTSVKSAEQILELLKEKKPRLLTLEEVKQADVVWNEWGSVYGYVECMLFDRIDVDGDLMFAERTGATIYFSPSEYNESWRCWSARPTDEQMKETEWDGEQK